MSVSRSIGCNVKSLGLLQCVVHLVKRIIVKYCYNNMIKQAGAEMGQAQPQLA